MIRVENVSKKYGDYQALNHISMHVPEGVVYGLVGPNGAGKSTLIRHLVGIYPPEEGSIRIGGEEIYENITMKSKCGYIPDDFFYFQQASVKEMKRFYKDMYPDFDENVFEKTREAFQNVPLNKSIRRLSKGMQKQAAFWLTISCRPKVLILDEPVDGLDPVMRRQVWNLIRSDVVENGTTVLVSSHNLLELESVCNYVGILHKGQMRLERSLSELQGGVCKIQAVFQEGIPAPPENLDVLHMSNSGRVYTLIVKGKEAEAKKAIWTMHPILVDILPLTLEEIFIYELGGADYAVKDILF